MLLLPRPRSLVKNKMSSSMSDSDEGFVTTRVLAVEYDEGILGPIKIKNATMEQKREKRLRPKEFKEKMASVTLWFSLRLISLFLVAYLKDITTPEVGVEKLWEKYADMCIRQKTSIASDSAEALRNTEYSFFRRFKSESTYPNGMALEAMRDEIMKLITDHPNRVTFLRPCGFLLFSSFINVENLKDIRDTPPFPPIASTHVLMNIIGSISDRDIGKCINSSSSCFRDSKIGRWVNFVAKYPSELSGSAQLSEQAAQIVNRWKKIVYEVRHDTFAIDRSTDDEDYGDDDDDEHDVKDKRRGQDKVKQERQSAYIAAALAHREDTDDDDGPTEFAKRVRL
ncbi:Hypothetical protein DHA2_13310 [Giardia duodenalis]|uniref:TFIIS N-terminal domain-containing protein n=1 Tax=Giardia intestinalis TaxID=5741 RepID=V6TJT5_GIAIN|nr:Hypothetical protein DHA2_13310 [Giardia intestinalis]